MHTISDELLELFKNPKLRALLGLTLEKEVSRSGKAYWCITEKGKRRPKSTPAHEFQFDSIKGKSPLTAKDFWNSQSSLLSSKGIDSETKFGEYMVEEPQRFFDRGDNIVVKGWSVIFEKQQQQQQRDTHSRGVVFQVIRLAEKRQAHKAKVVVAAWAVVQRYAILEGETDEFECQRIDLTSDLVFVPVLDVLQSFHPVHHCTKETTCHAEHGLIPRTMERETSYQSGYRFVHQDDKRFVINQYRFTEPLPASPRLLLGLKGFEYVNGLYERMKKISEEIQAAGAAATASAAGHASAAHAEVEAVVVIGPDDEIADSDDESDMDDDD
ncbi:hypothetical protein H9P43_003473 [Blastocladiella emersonii ATCC 22665]|nr:hypothetical protein H9P43_008304 [Blastocladiella emersonii ATCC 22665]KAI9184420.1 hypothetical protein H9P43_003473 [Blastocladiella emersonii ATCC 22665]